VPAPGIVQDIARRENELTNTLPDSCRHDVRYTWTDNQTLSSEVICPPHGNNQANLSGFVQTNQPAEGYKFTIAKNYAD